MRAGDANQEYFRCLSNETTLLTTLKEKKILRQEIFTKDIFARRNFHEFGTNSQNFFREIHVKHSIRENFFREN